MFISVCIFGIIFPNFIFVKYQDHSLINYPLSGLTVKGEIVQDRQHMERIIGVIGSGRCSSDVSHIGYEVGRLIALHGGILITGGLGGVMEAASRGAKDSGGITVGILPGTSREDANPYVDIPVLTDMGHARNVILVRSAQAVIAIAGEYGTLSEIALALKTGKPVIGLHTPWHGIEGLIRAETPVEAVDIAFKLIGGDG